MQKFMGDYKVLERSFLFGKIRCKRDDSAS